MSCWQRSIPTGGIARGRLRGMWPVAVAVTGCGGSGPARDQGGGQQQGEQEHGDRDERVGVTGDQPGAGGQVPADRGDQGDAERGSDLVAGHHQPGRQTRRVVRHVGHRADRDRHEHRADPDTHDQEPGQHVRGVRRVAAGSREQQRPGGGDHQAGRDQGAGPGVRQQLGGDRGTQRDGGSERQELQPGDHRRGAEDLLEVQRAQEDRADDGTGDASHHGRGRDQRPDPPDPRRDQRRGNPELDERERGQQDRGDGGADEGGAVGPAVAGGGLHGVDQGDQAADQGDGSGDVEAAQAGACTRAGGDGAQGADQDGDADGDVDEEHRAPVERAGEQSAEEDADGDAHAGDGAPHGECGGALLAGVRGHHHRHGGGGEQGGAGALGGAGDDERGRGVREPAGQRGAGEQGQAEQEHPAPVEQVGHPAPEQQQASAEQHVGADRPLVGRGGQVQVGADAGQRHVHDADVEHDHELGGQHQAEHRPRTTLAVVSGLRRVGARVGGGGHETSWFSDAAGTRFPGRHRLTMSLGPNAAGSRRENRRVVRRVDPARELAANPVISPART